LDEEIDEDELILRQAEERQKRIQQILEKHKGNEGTTQNEGQNYEELNKNLEEDKQEAQSSSSSNDEGVQKVKKMDEENVKLLKMLEKERNNLKNEVFKELELNEESKSQKSDEDSFDMFNVDSDNEGKFNHIDEAVKKGFQVDTQDINVDADGYYQPKAGEIIDGRKLKFDQFSLFIWEQIQNYISCWKRSIFISGKS
jgi:hypothetical protein